MDYKQLNETGEKVEKEEVESNQTEEVSNLFRTISISKRFAINQRRGKYGQAESRGFSNGWCNNWGRHRWLYWWKYVENVLSIVEVDEKIQWMEELRTAYRRKHNEVNVLLGSNCE